MSVCTCGSAKRGRPGGRADTEEGVVIAALGPERHTQTMGIRYQPLMALLAVGVITLPATADEIRLKDGKKLYGVIVAYEENMFKVKTDFGYVLVEKDKIASIIPSTGANPAEKTEASAVKDEAAKRAAESESASTTDGGLPNARSVGARTSDAKPRTPPAAQAAKAEAP